MKQIVSLMHKDVPTLTFVINRAGMCIKVISLQNSEHLPPSLVCPSQVMDVNEFLVGRRISLNREDVASLLWAHSFQPEWFLPQHYLSVFDTYWLKYDDEDDLKWKDVSFFQHSIPIDALTIARDLSAIEDVRDLLSSITRDSPNLTMPFDRPVFAFTGENHSIRLLRKYHMGDQVLRLQKEYQKFLPVQLCESVVIGDELFYLFDGFTSDTAEYIPFSHYFDALKKNPVNSGKTNEELFFDCLNKYQFPDYTDYISSMLSLDDHFGIDRDLQDFGILRNPDTLKVISFAPIFCYPNVTANR